MAEFRIRAAHPEDGEAVARLAAALSRHEEVPAPDFNAERFRSEGFGPDAAFAAIVAEQDGGVIGYAIHYGGYDVQTGTRGRHVADLFVEEAHRDKGVGRALVAAAARAGRAQGARWLLLQVRRDNDLGQGFYKALGGREDLDRTYIFDGIVFESLAAPE